jgi:hypothetical protein
MEQVTAKLQTVLAVKACCLCSQILCAGVNISPGSHVSVCYTDPLWGTESRRHHLADSWYFECSCPRCSDSTEFGTMYSSIKCKKK